VERAIVPVAGPLAAPLTPRTSVESPVTMIMTAVVLVAVAMLGTVVAGAARRWSERRFIDKHSVAMGRLRGLARCYGVEERSSHLASHPETVPEFLEARTPPYPEGQRK
jgi:hypothetical protein